MRHKKVGMRARAGPAVPKPNQTRRRAPRVETIEPRLLLSVSLVSDHLFGTQSSSFGAAVILSGNAIFVASTPNPGLWSSDGTAAGTILLKDFGPDPSAGVQQLAAVGRAAYFSAPDGNLGRELWRTDGTPQGTGPLLDLASGPNSSDPADFTDVNGTVFFTADDGDHAGRELWKSDGTAAGTLMVKDIFPGTAASDPQDLTHVKGTLFFTADDGDHGRELWKSDGTAAGTVMVKDIRAGGLGAQLSDLTNFNGTLLFAASDGNRGIELWKSDGTAAGTVLVDDVDPGRGSSSPAGLTVVGGTTFFTASTASSGRELWKTDGTAAGTSIVKDLNPAAGSSSPAQLVAYNDKLFFTADAGSGALLWVSDGTSGGTVSIPTPSAPGWLAAAAGHVFFASTDPAHGAELWATDGTAAGTDLVQDTNPGPAGANPTPLIASGGSLLLAADDGTHGTELWKTDGTATDTQLVADLNTSAVPGAPSNLFEFHGSLYLDGPGGLYRSDGTGNSATLVAPVGAVDHVVAGDSLFFTTADGSLWRTDGAASGSRLLKTFPFPISGLTAFQGKVYFGGRTAKAQDPQLWTSDGTPEGTTLLSPVYAPQAFAVVGSNLFFYGYDSIDSDGHGFELWKTDGTSSGTAMVQDIQPGPASSAFYGAPPTVLRNVNGTLVFPALTDQYNHELWQSDGTASGTRMIKDLNGTREGSLQTDPGDPRNTLVVLNGTGDFFANPGTSAGGLWKTDGTAAGTVQVANFDNNSFGSYGLTPVGNQIFFVDKRAGDHREYDLWRSDGTAGGTRLVRRFVVDGTSGDPGIGPITDVNGVAYFPAWNAADGIGTELWRSDGTTAGTVAVADVNPGPGPSSPQLPLAIGGTLYFLAYDGTHGIQLFKNVPASTPPVAPQGLSATALSAFHVKLTWQPPGTDTNEYRLERSTASDFSDVDGTFTIWAPAQSFADVVAEPGVTTYYRLTALNEAGAAASVTLITPPYPQWPTGVSTIDPQLSNYVNQPVVAYRDQVFYFGFTGGNTTGVLRTDGTSSSAIFTTANIVDAMGLTPDGRFLTFEERDSQHNVTTQWWSDGTATGTFPFPPPAQPIDNSLPPGSVSVRGIDYYVAADASGVTQLFRTDGTPQGTVQLTQLSKPATGVSRYPAGIFAALGQVFFFVDTVRPNGTVVSDFWKTDGTPQGTALISSFSRPIGRFVVAAGKIFFADPDVLYVSDGTAAGTQALKTFSGYVSSGPDIIQDLVSGGDRVYFTSHQHGPNLPSGDPGFIGQLWTSDGTADGTVQLTGLPATKPVLQDSPGPLVPVLGSVYFRSDQPDLIRGLFHAVADSSPPTAPTTPADLAAVSPNGDEVDVTWTELSATEDGYVLERSTSAAFDSNDRAVTLPAGTDRYADNTVNRGTTYYYRLRAFNAGGASPETAAVQVTVSDAPPAPSNLSAVAVDGHTVNLNWTDNANNEEGFRLDRSTSPDFLTLDASVQLPENTNSYVDQGLNKLTKYYYRLSAFNSSGSSAAVSAVVSTPDVPPAAPTGLIASGSAASEIDLRWADNASNAAGYRVDRQTAGGHFAAVTTLPPDATFYADTSVTPGVFYQYRVVAVNPIGQAASNTSELVTTAPPVLSKQIASIAYAPLWLTNVNGTVFFGSNGLWKTDGTPTGTVKIDSHDPQQITELGGKAFFVADDPATSVQPWITDGTPGGTHLIIQVVSGGGTTIRVLGVSQGDIYFLEGYGGGSPLQVWKTDGTDAGTVLFSGSAPISFIDPYTINYGLSNGIAYFPAGNSLDVAVLYRSDGTAAGTHPLLTSSGSQIGFQAHALTDVNGTLFFYGNDTAGHSGLWRVDNTTGNAVLVKAGTIGGLVAMGGKVYFYYAAPTDGGLWVTDGTAAGTGFVARAAAPESDNYVPHPVVLNGTIYYLAHGSLWKSDGTAAGTGEVAAFQPPQNIQPYLSIFTAGNLVFFTDAVNLWRSDGTPQGTYQVAPIDTYVSLPQAFPYQSASAAVAVGDRVLFDSFGTAPASTGLYAADLTIPAAPTDLTVAGDGTANVTLTWTDHSTNESGVVIERSTTGDFESLDHIFYTPVGATRFTDTTAVPGTTYYYRVRGLNAGGASGPTNVAPPAAGRPAAAQGDTTASVPPGQSSFSVPGSGPLNLLVPGPGGKLLATQNGQLDLIDLDGTVTQYPTPFNPNNIFAFASDAAGNAWAFDAFDRPDIGLIERMDPAGHLTKFTAPGIVSALAAGPDGGMWFVSGPDQNHVNRIGEIADDGTISTTPLDTTLDQVLRMVYGPGGDFWAAQPQRSEIVRITPTGKVTAFSTAPPTYPTGDPVSLAVGPDGNVWFTEQTGRIVGKVTPAGVVTKYQTSGDPTAITAGPDGALWFAEYNAGYVGRITPDGSYSRYPVAAYAISRGGDGNVWFTKPGFVAEVGRFNLDVLSTVSTGAPIDARRSVPVTAQLATITDASGLRAASDYTVDILWGGGGESPGTVTPVGPGKFIVSGTHTFANDGLYPITLTVTPANDMPVTTFAKATVDYPLAPVAGLHPVTFLGVDAGPLPLITFSDADPAGSASDFSATIDWGDGTSSAGTIQKASVQGTFVVIGGHAYNGDGAFPVHVHVADFAGAEVDAGATVQVNDPVMLEPAVSYPAPAATAEAVADVNGDGIPDVVLAAGNGIAVLPGQGDGTFGMPIITTLQGPVLGLTLVDLNRDGKPDIVYPKVLRFAGAQVPQTGVLLGNGDGTFKSAADVAVFADQSAVADFNGDGVPDVIASGDYNNLSILLGNGDGTFNVVNLPFGGPLTHYGLVTGDFNGDAKQDFALSLADQGADDFVSVYFGNGDGTFKKPLNIPLPHGIGIPTERLFLTTGDFNGDSKPDLATYDRVTNTFSLLLNNGDGTFAAPVNAPLEQTQATPPQAAGVTAFRAADVNGDGLADLVFTDAFDHSLRVRLSRGDGNFAPESIVSLPAAPADGQVGDLNGDGLPDVVAAASSGNVSVVLGTALHVTPASVTATEDLTATLTLATFTNEDGANQPELYSATIDWGDGHTASGAITLRNGLLSVTGSKSYAEEGRYTAKVTIRGPHGTAAIFSTMVVVGDAPLSATAQPVAATAGAPFTAVLARFTDGNVNAGPGDFGVTVVIQGKPVPAVVRADGQGGFIVTITGSVDTAGSYSAAVTIKDVGGATTSLTVAVTIAAPVHGGGSISGVVFNDQNTDGVREVGEPPLFAQTVFLDLNGNGQLDAGEPRALSAADGTYTIADVAEGAYSVKLAAASGFQVTTPIDSGAVEVSVVNGQILSGEDFGEARLTTAVVGRHLLAGDGSVLPTDALRPGHTATSANYSNSSLGIPLVAMDVSNLPGIVTAADFGFRVGRDNNPAVWEAAPPPVSVILTPLPNHTTRITIAWPEGAIRNQWLQVTLKANGNTGLPVDDVFYFGNLVGDASGSGRVDFASLLALAQQYGAPKSPSTTADFNGDGKIDFSDLLVLAQAYDDSLPMISTPLTAAVAAPALDPALLTPLDGAGKRHRSVPTRT